MNCDGPVYKGVTKAEDSRFVDPERKKERNFKDAGW